jgi:ubiquinone/menaquinone biosynthesis C-methylase UbiE
LRENGIYCRIVNKQYAKGASMSNQDNPEQVVPQLDIVNQIIDQIYRLGAVRAALELQLWEKIAAGEDTPAKLATAEGWDPAGVQVLLDAACGMGLLKSEGGRYFLVPESSYYLLPSQPAYQGVMIQNEFGWEGYGQLAESIRSGKRPVHYDATNGNMVGLWISAYSGSWAYPERFLAVSDKLWQSLGITAREGLRVLDLACGPAPRSMALARQHPGVQLTWLDWEGILQTAYKTAAGLGISSQITILPGDLRETDIGSDRFDVAYLGNVTHFFNVEENTRLFRRVHIALVKGGRIVVHSAVRREGEGAALDALWLYAATARGGAHDFAAYRTMLENAGFTQITEIDKGPIRAEKP